MKKLNEIISDEKTHHYHEMKKAVIEPIHNELAKHYKFQAHEKDYVRHYTDSGINSRHMNRQLWNQHQDPNFSTSDEIHNHIENLHDVLKNHKTPRKLTVWSGTKEDPRNKMNSEGVVHHPGFLSTSLLHRQATAFGKITDIKDDRIDEPKQMTRHILKIAIPKGHPGAYVDHISDNAGEKEFILPPGTNLKLNRHSERTFHDGPNYIEHHHIHHATIVPKEE